MATDAPTATLPENIFGTISLILWSIQLIPQIIHNFQRKTTAGSSMTTVLIWFSGSLLLTPYYIYKGLNVPMILQAHTFSLLSMIWLLQIIYYDGWRVGCGRTRHPWHTFFTFIVCACCWIGLEMGLLAVLNATHSVALGSILAITSAVAGLGGLVAQIMASILRRSTEGLSLVFLWLDFLGGIAGIISLIFRQGDFDVLVSLLFIGVSLGQGILIALTFIFGRSKVRVDDVKVPETGLELEIVDVDNDKSIESILR
jgi:uncharacterized protein with PQ loop repeat